MGNSCVTPGRPSRPRASQKTRKNIFARLVQELKAHIVARSVDGLTNTFEREGDSIIRCINELDATTQSSRLGNAYPLGWVLTPNSFDSRLRPSFMFGTVHAKLIELLLQKGADVNAENVNYRTRKQPRHYPRQLTPLECALLFWPWDLAPVWYLVVKAHAEFRLPHERPAIFASKDPRSLWLLLWIDAKKGDKMHSFGGSNSSTPLHPLYLCVNSARTIKVDPTLSFGENAEYGPNAHVEHTEDSKNTLKSTLVATLLDVYLPIPNGCLADILSKQAIKETLQKLPPKEAPFVPLHSTNEPQLGSDLDVAKVEKKSEAYADSGPSSFDEADSEQVMLPGLDTILIHSQNKSTWRDDFMSGLNIGIGRAQESKEDDADSKTVDYSFLFDLPPLSTIDKKNTEGIDNHVTVHSHTKNDADALDLDQLDIGKEAELCALSMNPKLFGRGTDGPLRLGEFFNCLNDEINSAHEENRDVSHLTSTDAWTERVVQERRSALLMIFILLRFGLNINQPLDGEGSLSLYEFAQARVSLWQSVQWPAHVGASINPQDLNPFENSFLEAIKSGSCWLKDDFEQIERSVMSICESTGAKMSKSEIKNDTNEFHF